MYVSRISLSHQTLSSIISSYLISPTRALHHTQSPAVRRAYPCNWPILCLMKPVQSPQLNAWTVLRAKEPVWVILSMISVSILIYIHICTYVYVYVCVYPFMFRCLHASASVCSVCVCTCMCMYACMNSHRQPTIRFHYDSPLHNMYIYIYT